MPIADVRAGDIVSGAAGRKDAGRRCDHLRPLDGRREHVDRRKHAGRKSGRRSGHRRDAQSLRQHSSSARRESGKDTALAQHRALVQQAQGSRAPVQRLVDQVSAVFVPVVLLIALATFVVWYHGDRRRHQALMFAVAVLVIACPCALGLATPDGDHGRHRHRRRARHPDARTPKRWSAPATCRRWCSTRPARSPRGGRR